jgi:hypothetical protein
MVEGHLLVTVFVTMMTDRAEASGRSNEYAEDEEGILLPSDVVIVDTGVTGVIFKTVGVEDADRILLPPDVVITATGVTGIMPNPVELEGPFGREADPAEFEDQAGRVTSNARLAFRLNCSILSPGLIAKTMPA